MMTSSPTRAQLQRGLIRGRELAAAILAMMTTAEMRVAAAWLRELVVQLSSLVVKYVMADASNSRTAPNLCAAASTGEAWPRRADIDPLPGG